MFTRSRAIMGGGDWWWHAEGAWGCSYEQVRSTMASDQRRRPAFGAADTCVPELFPKKMMLFIDGEEWRSVRGVFEANLSAETNWEPRVADLRGVLKPFMPSPCTLSTLTKEVSDKMVTVAVWFLLFGVKLTDAQARTAAQWGASGMAGYFVFPRLIQRILFNKLLAQVRQLRTDTLGIARSHGLQPLFERLHDEIGRPYRSESALALCDELMYAVNFAGVGGTQHGCWATLRFMQRATADISPGDVTFPTGSMLELYRRDPVAFIKETVRLDAPVTSATCVFKEARDIAFDVSCCGGTPVSHHVADGTLHQYVLSVANRDPAKFEAPNTFNPSRANLDEMLGWNGTIAGGAAQYPRFCPGQKLAIVVIQTICSLLQELGDTAA